MAMTIPSSPTLAFERQKWNRGSLDQRPRDHRVRDRYPVTIDRFSSAKKETFRSLGRLVTKFLEARIAAQIIPGRVEPEIRRRNGRPIRAHVWYGEQVL